MQTTDYPLLVMPIQKEDGGGFMATVPDLPGCMSDGETPDEAVRNVQDAIAEWIDAARQLGRPIPTPRTKLAVA